MMENKTALKKALRDLAKAMAKLKLDKIEGYKQVEKPEEKEDEEEGLMKVLEAHRRKK